jgi:hypothetical protein
MSDLGICTENVIFVVRGLYLIKRWSCPVKTETKLGFKLVGRCLVWKGAEAIAAGPRGALITVFPPIVCTGLKQGVGWTGTRENCLLFGFIWPGNMRTQTIECVEDGEVFAATNVWVFNRLFEVKCFQASQRSVVNQDGYRKYAAMSESIRLIA